MNPPSSTTSFRMLTLGSRQYHPTGRTPVSPLIDSTALRTSSRGLPPRSIGGYCTTGTLGSRSSGHPSRSPALPLGLPRELPHKRRTLTLICSLSQGRATARFPRGFPYLNADSRPRSRMGSSEKSPICLDILSPFTTEFSAPSSKFTTS